MKLFTVVSAVIATKMCLIHPAVAQTVDNSTMTTNSCYMPCENLDEYCEVSTGVCRGPNYDGECFNPATSAYQDVCDPGFECVDNKCDYIDMTVEEPIENAVASDSNAGCGDCEVLGEFCDSNTNECRVPSYDGECYNTVTSTFQDGCDDGYVCSDNVCQVVAFTPVPTATNSDTVCYLLCSAGNYCENGTDECRGPSYDGECFNPATGHFQIGCDPGFVCSYNKCEYV